MAQNLVEIPNATPYLTITNITASIDSGLEHFVEELTLRNPLKEISVNEAEPKPSSNTKNFTRIDGDYPEKTKVVLYEQMVYHRAGSTNANPLEIFIPFRYKINFEQISEYFKEMFRSSDPETLELINIVISAYGNNNNSLFYRHTLPGKTTAKTSASSSRTLLDNSSIVFNLNKEIATRIQNKIDKWHNNYIDWCFYRNATRFFIENQDLAKDELFTVKQEFTSMLDENGELMKIINEITKKYEALTDRIYTPKIDDFTRPPIRNRTNPKEEDEISRIITYYIQFFKIIYDEIKNHMMDTMDYTREREKNMGYDYKFDENIKKTLFKTYSDIKEILEMLAAFGDNIEDTPVLKYALLFKLFTEQIDGLNKLFPPKLKNAFDYNIAQNKRTNYNEYYKTYKLLQYVYWIVARKISGVGIVFDGTGTAIYVHDIIPNSPAATNGGINQNDVLLSVGPYPVSATTTIRDVNKYIFGLNHTPITLKFRDAHNTENIITIQRNHNDNENFRTDPYTIIDSEEEGDGVFNKLLTVLYENVQLSRITVDKYTKINDMLTTYNEYSRALPEIEAYLENREYEYNRSRRIDILMRDDIQRLKNNIREIKKLITDIEKKHVEHLIGIYKYGIFQESMHNFIEKFIKFDFKNMSSYEDTISDTSIELPIGIDILFYLLYRVTNNMVTFLKSKKDIFNVIDDKNIDLQTLQQDIQSKEHKIKTIFDLISIQLGIPVEKIIPNRESYVIKDNTMLTGLINSEDYKNAWKDNISINVQPTSEIAKKVNYVTRKMMKSLDKALGISADIANQSANDPKIKALLISLLEHNTVQVAHMLFAKPRDIWYSPDMLTNSLSSLSKWAFFQLEKPEIISKSAMK